jgi:hypothetical protein
LIATARRLFVLRLARATSRSRPAVADQHIALLTIGGLLAVNQMVLAAGGHAFVGTCVDAVVLVLTLNLAAFLDDARGDRATIEAFGALALAATIPLAGAALPLRHMSQSVGTLTIAFPVAASTLYFASRRTIRLRPLFTRSAYALQVLAVLAAAMLGFCAFLLRAPELQTDHPGRAALGVVAVLVSAAVEELLFRGVLQTTLTRVLGGTGVMLSIVVSAALFTSFGWWMLAALAATIVFAIVAPRGGLGSAFIAHAAFVIGAVLVWPAVFDHTRPNMVAAVPLGLVFSVALVALVAGASRSRERTGV